MQGNAILLSDLIQRGMFSPQAAHVLDDAPDFRGTGSAPRVDARGNADFGMSPLAYSSLLLSQRLAALAEEPERNRAEILKAVESFVADLERLR
jgi:hypothetical protein